MGKMAFAAAVVLILVPVGFAADHTKDTPADVKKALEDDKAVLLDVREKTEWDDGHLKDAKSLPLSDLKAGVSAEKLKELIPAGKVVYVHCASGVRSLKAAELLTKAGYEPRPLKPGYADLVRAGLPKAK